MSPSTRFILASSCAALIAHTVSAADPSIFIWDGGGANTSFSEATNWLLDTAPDGGDVLRFPTATNSVVTGINAYNGFRIFFESGAGSYTLSGTGTGATLFDFTADTTNGAFYSAGANAPKIENNSANLQTLNVPLTLTSTTGASEINPVDGDLLFGSTVTVTNTQQLRIFGNNAKTVTFNGVISGTGSTVAINQNSNVVYGAANTYTGDTFINAGSLSFAPVGSLTAGTLQLGDTNATGAAATLRISDLDGGTTINRPIIVRAGSTGVKTIAAANTSGTNTFSGTVTMNDNTTVDVAAGGTLAMSGIVSGAKTVTKTGDGLLTLGAANTFSGGLVLNGGRTQLTAVNTISGGITLNAGGTLELKTPGDGTTFNNFLGAAGNSFTFNGGTLLMNAATTATVDRTLTGRNITVNAGGATIDTQGAYTNFTEGIFNQLRFNNASVLSGSGTFTKNGGGRLSLQNNTGSGFSGAVVINNGTLESVGTALGNSSATNTVTINGGNWAIGGNASQAITLNGGAISTNGGSRSIDGTVDVTAGSHIFLNDFWRDFDLGSPVGTLLGRTLTVNGVVSGDDALGIAVNRAGWTSNNGTVVLKNPGNTYSGTLTVGKNLRLENNPTGSVGKTLGTANILLADGGLNLRDNGSAAGDTGATFNYGNNVTLIAPADIFDRGLIAGSAFIDVNRASGTAALNNTFKLGTLTMAGRPLTVQGGNGYGVEFGGASQMGGNETFNTTTASLTFSGGLTEDAAGRTITKNGNGALIFTSEAAYTGATTVNGGSLVLAGSSGRLNGTPSITLNRASLNIDNSTAVVADRVGNAVPITGTNSSISFTSLAGSATNTSETLGAVTFSGGRNTIAANQGDAGAISALTIASLTRQNDAIVNFVGTNLGQTGNSSRIIIADQTTDVAYLGPRTTINGADFAQYVTATDGTFVRGVTAVGYVTDPVNDTGFTAVQNLRLTGTTTTSLTANRTVNTVNFANAANTRTLDLGANTLTLAGGGLIVGTNAAAITGTGGGGLTSGTSELIITNNAALNIGAPIVDGGSAVAVTKVGLGTLTLSGANAFTGDLSIGQGTLSVGDVAASGVASNIGAGTTLRLGEVAATTFQFTGADSSTNRALLVGTGGATIDVANAGNNLTWNGPLNSSGSFRKIGPGTLTLGGATNTISGDLNVGNGSGTTGALVGTNGGSLSVGSGSGNSINVGYETIGNTANNVGILDLSGLNSFTANVSDIRVGGEGATANTTGNNAGTLILAQNNTITASNSILVADTANNGDAGIRGTLTFGSGTSNVTTPLLTIGGRKYSGVSSIAAGGTLTLNNGVTGRTLLNVGVNNAADTGTIPVSSFDLTGGTLVANLSNVAVGIRAGGGATGDATGTLHLGDSAATNVNINVAAGFALRVGGLDYGGGIQPTGESATGTMTIGGGTVSITSTNASSSAVVIGHFNGTAVINGATAVNAADGTLTIDGGNVTVTSAGTANAINLAPRAVATGTNATASSAATGTLNINGGSLTVNNPIAGNSTAAESTSNLNLTGGLLNMQGKNISNINNLTFSGGTLRNLGTLNRALTQTGETSLLDVAANNSTISGAYSVTDGDVKIAATRILNATGGTVLNGTASLLVNGTLQGGLTVNSGASVSGSGTTQAFTLAGGTIAPGTSPGTLNVAGNLTLSGGNLSLEINSNTAGTGYDQLNVTGTVSLTDNTNFTLTLGYVPAIGHAFTIINNDASDSVAFSNGALMTYNGGAVLADGAHFTTAQGFEFQINYAGGTGNDVVLTTVVPEPTSAILLSASIGALAGLKRFRRRQRS